MADHPSHSLSRYELRGKIGQGGMGAVYRAIDLQLRREVAIKFVSGESLTARRCASFLREARLAAALNHPSICTIHEVGEVSADDAKKTRDALRLPAGTPFLVMELVEGSTLDDRRAEAGPLTLEEILDVAEQIADALAEAHGRGIIHRDLKPKNVMVTTSGKVKILDFGLAKALGHAPGGEQREDVPKGETATITRVGVLAGTPAYMSPEQARGLPVDARSDVFSFGTMLHELVTDRRPFGGDSTVSTLAKIVEADHAPLSDFRSGIPTELERIVGRCLHKRPERRYNDTRDLVNSIRDLRTSLRDRIGEASEPDEPGSREASRSRLTGPTRTAFAGWCAEQTVPGLNPETCAQIIEYVIGEQERDGGWPGQGDHWSLVKTACILNALASLGFKSRDRWTVANASSRHDGGPQESLEFLSRKLTRLSVEEGLVGEDLWDTCQVLLALEAFGRAAEGKQYANEINLHWKDHYRKACDAVPRISWTGPAYLAAIGDVIVAYEPLLENPSRIDEIVQELRSLERTEDGTPMGAYRATGSDEPHKHRWNTALVLRSLASWPEPDVAMIARTSGWLLEQLERADEWLGPTDRESPMYLARCLDGLHAALPVVSPALREKIQRALLKGNARIEAFWSPNEAERTGDLKAYSAVLEYLADWTLTIPAGLVFGLTSARR